MKSVSDLRAAFAIYHSEMERCEKAGAFWALLHLVLTLPDICAALEEAPACSNPNRYVEWCDENFPQNRNITSGDRYQMRNAVLHQGSTLTESQTTNPKRIPWPSFDRSRSYPFPYMKTNTGAKMR